jgi:hypothetical protein
LREHRLDKDEPSKSALVSTRTRAVVFIAGSFVALAGSLAMGPAFLMYPAVMLLGALLQPRFRALGRGLMLGGALLLSAWVFPYGIGSLLGAGTSRHSYVTAFAFGAVLLMAICDVALVMEEIRIRRTASAHLAERDNK